MGLAVLGYLQHSYGFMIVTAVLGGFIAMIGVSSISADSNPGYIILTLMTEASETEKILLLAGSVLLAEYSRAMKSHFRKFGNQMSGSGNHLCNYAGLLA